MGLTLEKEQRLTAVGLTAFFDANQAVWVDAARQAKNYVSGNFPAGSAIRRDDIAKPLEAVMEVNMALRTFLSAKRLKQKYWVGYFTDLIVERSWDQL